MGSWDKLQKKLRGPVTGDDIGFYIYTFIMTAAFTGFVMTFIGIVWSILGLYGILIALAIGGICATREYTNDLKRKLQEGVDS